ncbi:MAG: hypothetical protein M1831_001116 [Alyxoria varia]|nr:MAG: hypothetical protein M1831_001116 [Alyxoria varia]
MATPHRGLPPPAAMTLPDPTRGPPSSLPQNLGHMPAPSTSSKWQVNDDAMKEWLGARAEEDKRKQEEEKTRQEELRLDQRRVEQNILRDSLHAGIPPHLVPVIFAGMGGGPLANTSLEMAHQHLTQLQQSAHGQQVVNPHSPEARHEQRMHGQPQYYAGQGPSPPGQTAPGQPPPPHQTVYPSPAYQSPKSRDKPLYGAPTQYGPSTSGRNPTQGTLPRLTTNEAAGSAPSSYGAQQQQQQQHQQQQQQQQDQPSPSPSIYFHHWQPPNANSGKDSQKTSPNIPSHVANSQGHSNSPKKRKTASSQHPAPPPSSTSPSFSVNSSNSTTKPTRGSSNRQRSGTSSSYDPLGRHNRGAAQREPSASGVSSSNQSHAGDTASRLNSPHQSAKPTPPKQEST